ncbi:FapA family protein [Pseudoalteromonas sp. YIC-827]|uniref:FapA family protein n=1 Tax=Pseudoalteromonas qingdaonensis TaxID=3131913 RepID=A0ABU9MW41_9GAMM
MFELTDNGQIIIKINGDWALPPSKALLLEALANSPFGNCDIAHTEIDKFYAGEQDASQLIVARQVDAQLEVSISDDKMTAIGRLTTPRGGKMLTLDEGKRAIVLAGVRRGYQQLLLERLLQQQLSQSAGVTVKGTLAKGRLPIDGKNSTLVKETLTLKDRINKPQHREDGTVDMRDFGKLASVEPGALLMTQKPATLGKEGYTVTGDIIAPKPGKQSKLIPGEGAALNPNNPLELIATTRGVPVETAQGMRVDDIFTIGEVNVKSGHIDFNGSVLVTQGVAPGMRVTAKGDITVLGTVESAELSAGGDICIKQGVFGHPNHQQDEHQLTCKISAGNEVYISHAQYAYVEGNDIHIERLASHCQLKAMTNIIIGAKDNPNGKLFGGEVLDACRLEAGEIGNESGAKMRINLLARSIDISTEQGNYTQQLSENDNKLSALQETLEKAEALKDKDKKKLLIEKIGATQLALVQQADELETKLASLDNTLSTLVSDAQLVAHHKLNPGVAIHILDKAMKTARQYPPCVLKLEKGKIELEFKTS